MASAGAGPEEIGSVRLARGKKSGGEDGTDRPHAATAVWQHRLTPTAIRFNRTCKARGLGQLGLGSDQRAAAQRLADVFAQGADVGTFAAGYYYFNSWLRLLRMR